MLISRCIAKLHAVTATGWSLIAFSISSGLLIYLGIFAAGSQLKLNFFKQMEFSSITTYLLLVLFFGGGQRCYYLLLNDMLCDTFLSK